MERITAVFDERMRVDLVLPGKASGICWIEVWIRLIGLEGMLGGMEMHSGICAC